ncbi:calmodulin-binding protein 60 D-like [Impatiens glandulifera]|uniref:calmodulin-binding protein 60 D-like n=1 Tax=Impatiens glandulifera TaxID=253017 RepID=UPI001FB12E9C|nr:calmodulin-binding protein 60 D-like [Impatiens glandulifera]
MHSRYMMDRSNLTTTTLARDKRSLDSTSTDEGQREPKRPALASVIVEALKVDSLQKLCSSLEPILRRVVSEEVERALAKLCPVRHNPRASPKRIQGLDGRNLQLQFRSRLSLPLFTGGKVEAEQGLAIHIVLIDGNTGQVVKSGEESCAKLDIVVLEGDFNDEDDHGWSQDDFDSHIVKEREGKRPLLTGELQVVLVEGVGTLGDMSFTDNSSWIRSRKFRLGLKVSSGCCEGVRIREAKTDAFTVKDHRGELYKKHYPPALTDEVWRLEKIGKDGSFHRRLNKAGVRTVEDFLRLVVRDAQRLRNILGSGMSNKMWDLLVEHAKTCVLSDKLYVYYPDDVKNIGVVFNNIYEFSGLIAGTEYHSADSLSETQKVYVDTLVKKAYENWMHVIEYDSKSLENLKENKSIEATAPNNVTMMPQDYSNSFESQSALPSFSASIPSQMPMNPLLPLVGQDTQYPNVPQSVNISSSIPFDSNPYPLHNQIMTQVEPQHPINEDLLSNFGPYSNYDDFNISEEEIRMRSHEMLENGDMQHLLRIFNMGGTTTGLGQSSINGSDSNNYPFNTPAAYNPNSTFGYGLVDDQGPPSGNAVLGWLKLKAALRWGIFVRKKAAERRAQLVDLDDY